jgi:hypothetical protein
MSQPTYDAFVFEEIRAIGRAWTDTNPGHHDNEQLFEKIGEMSWRRLIDNKPVWQIMEEIGVDGADYGYPKPVTPPIPPVDPVGLNVWPRIGMSIASLIVARACNIAETVKIYHDCGVQLTRVNLLSALWDNEYGKVDVLPYRQRPDGTWDLTDWNPEYFDRLSEVRDRCNSAGIVVQWTNYELYSWSDRKQGPQQTNTPWRHNANGVFWAEDDSTFDVLPDWWSETWLKTVMPYLRADINPLEIGNEFPEKELHERVRDIVKVIEPTAQITVNRNEDTPGQYANMKIGTNYTRIAFHGRLLKQVSDLDRVYSKEPTYKTFNQFFDNCPHDAKRVIFSSDGARISADPVDTYDWGPLREFVQEIRRRGCSFEHQSRAKMTPPPNHHMIETDWFRSLL